ncbi:MAG TPA: polysaccharide deacetylase family protein [Chitinophagaceae bacterium]|jgi:peptidoglycan/xylan/chitin deacetylase (PgdA/CDA1 family)|nr:polysaccharide deacetylase family protein [Chitinophagaceae bacterium]
MTYRKINILFCAILLLLIIIDWQLEISFIIYLIIGLVFIAINTWGAIFVSSQFFLPTKCRGSNVTGSVAITFDDGPAPGKTEKILEILKHSGVKATFFCIGKNVKASPELTNRIHLEGHLIGNHSFFHNATFDLQSSEKIKEELINTNLAIQEVTGLSPKFFRPPYGVTNPMLAKAVKDVGQVTIGWSIRSFDTITTSDKKLFKRVTNKLQAGDIILFHDRCQATIEILPDLLVYIKNRGLKVEPLDKLINEKAYG